MPAYLSWMGLDGMRCQALRNHTEVWSANRIREPTCSYLLLTTCDITIHFFAQFLFWAGCELILLPIVICQKWLTVRDYVFEGRERTHRHGSWIVLQSLVGLRHMFDLPRAVCKDCPLLSLKTEIFVVAVTLRTKPRCYQTWSLSRHSNARHWSYANRRKGSPHRSRGLPCVDN